jgi:hypothetical protein
MSHLWLANSYSLSGFSPGRPRGIGPRGPLETAAQNGFEKQVWHASVGWYPWVMAPQQLAHWLNDLHALQSDDAARDDINEAFLLHGIPKQTLFKVLNNGLSDKFSGGKYAFCYSLKISFLVPYVDNN